jgi:hypothetical protein
MPDRDIATIRDFIYYQCAKIIAKSAFAASDGEGSQGQTLWVHQADLQRTEAGHQGLVGL